jgi:hypothetical protein
MTEPVRGRAQRAPVKLAVAVLVALALAAVLWLAAMALALVPVTSGDGWRLAAETHVDARSGAWTGTPNGEVLAGAGTAAAAWDDYGAPGSLNLGAQQALVRVTTYGSGSCPLFLAGFSAGLDSVRLRLSRGLVTACTADAVPQTFLILVERKRLPGLPFLLIVDAPDFPGQIEIQGLG